MVSRGAHARTQRRPQDHGALELSAEQVVHLGRLVAQLIHADGEEVHEEDLYARPESRHRCPHRGPTMAVSEMGVSSTLSGNSLKTP